MNKRLSFFAAIAAVIVTIVLILPCADVSAKSKSKMPKNGQTFTSETFKEHLGKDLLRCEWEVKTSKKGVKSYYPIAIRKSNGAHVYASSMYVKVGKRTYYVNKSGKVVKTNPDGYKVSKYLYIIEEKETVSNMPKNGQATDCPTLEIYLGKDFSKSYWIVEKVSGEKKYRPVAERKNGTICYCSKMYCVVDGKSYFTDENGYIVWTNPDGYEVAKEGYVIYPEKITKTSAASDTSPSSEASSDIPKTSSKDYTIQKYGDKMVCIDKNGNFVTGFVDKYYFSTYDYSMAVGLTYVIGDYYYFSDKLDSLGEMQKNVWVNQMYFGKDGRAYKETEATINGKTYYFNSSGCLQTGWINGKYYSADPDRYGELVPGVTK